MPVLSVTPSSTPQRPGSWPDRSQSALRPVHPIRVSRRSDWAPWHETGGLPGPPPMSLEAKLFDNFWNIVLWFFWVFAFVAYLFVLISIFGDLFRDRKLSGGWKALWVLFLIFVPFLTALIYLIARGSGMQERSIAEAQKAQEATNAYIKSVATSASAPSEEISKAAALLAAGTITQAEY